jgi:hypothetical protein
MGKALMLDWYTLVSGNDPKRWVKGTELERCFPEGFRHRFAIISVRMYDKDRNADVYYRVRDVEAAGDQHFRDGKPAPVFGSYETLEMALAAIEPHRPQEPVD